MWADRLPRHRVMVVTDLVRFALHALLAALIFADVVRIWELIAIEALFGTAEAFFRPAANGPAPADGARAGDPAGQRPSTLSNNIGEFAGPALATALVLGLGAGWAFALDAATFLLSAALPDARAPAARTRGRHGDDRARCGASARSASQRVGGAARRALREVRSRSWVWATLAAFCAALFTGLAPWFVLGPVVAREQYGDIGIYGLVSAALGLGTIAGSLLGIGWRPRFPMRAAMLAILLWPVDGDPLRGGHHARESSFRRS